MSTGLRLSVFACLLLGACGKSSSAPTQPTPAPANLPAPRLNVQIDSLGSAVAIVGVSRVSLDARETTGDKLRFELQFGDGASASGAAATHVYEAAGTYTATVTVTDGAGRQASTSRTVDVKAVQGSWFHFGYIERAGQPEVRRLTISSQQGSTLRGGLVRGLDRERPFTGQLTSERSVLLVLDDRSEQYEGVVPSQIVGADAVWSLVVRGGTADGVPLRFEPIVGEAVGPLPVARLSIEIDGDRSTAAVMGFTPIQFVAAASTGEALRYVIEAGDGEVATAPIAEHPCTRLGVIDARVTVADKFGRTSSARARYACVSLVSAFFAGWINRFQNPATQRSEFRQISFNQQTGATVGGFYTHPEGNLSHFTGELSGRNALRIVLDGGGIVFTGRVVQRDSFPDNAYFVDRHLILALTGGSADGTTLDFVYYDPY